MKTLAKPGTPDSAGIDAGTSPEAPVEVPAASPKTDTEAMPASGGSFIRQADGSLAREGDA